jgi:hypothetical protein
MNAIVAQQVSLSPVLAGQYRYLYDPSTGIVYTYAYDPYRGVYVLVFATGWVPAPEKKNVKYTQKLRITTSFYYSGPAFDGVLYGAIGQRVVSVFDEIVANTSPLSLPETPTPALKTASVEVSITTALAAGKDYSIYAKIMDAAGSTKAISDYLENAIHVVEVKPEFTEFKITDYAVV